MRTSGIAARTTAASARKLLRIVLPIAGLALATGAFAGTAAAQNPCVQPDAGSGTITMPPMGCDYLLPDEVHLIIDGLPPGTTIELSPIHSQFICGYGGGACSVPVAPACEAPGGSLGGNVDCFDSTLQFEVTGTGLLAGFSRFIALPAFTEVHTGPRNPGDAVQDFDTEMFQLQGQLFGDPDFDTLQVRAGSAFGLPSPGHTTLTRLGPPGSDFNVDSFFDIAYEIEFVGAPGSVLEGFGGTTTDTVRIGTGESLTQEIPALGQGGLVLLAGLVVASIWGVSRRRRSA